MYLYFAIILWRHLIEYSIDTTLTHYYCTYFIGIKI